MATSRTSSNIFWTTITSLVAGELLTKARLYTEALHRLQDNDGALLGRIAKVYSDLVLQDTGTKARIVGNVNMTTFDYNSGIALSGLTVIVDENTTTPQTCTFDNLVTGPDILLSQLTAACPTNLIWTLNDSGQLVSESQTTGAGSTMALGAGTAHSTIWPSPTITTPGAGTVNDGASRIGVAALAALSGGTLRSVLLALEGAILGVDDSTLITFGGTLLQMNYSLPGSLFASKRVVLRVPNLVASYTYTLPAATGDGYSAIFVMNPNPPETLTLKRPDNTTFAIMSGEFGVPDPGQQYVEVAQLGGLWSVIGWGITDDNYTLPS
jgi:hypothetical protein